MKLQTVSIKSRTKLTVPVRLLVLHCKRNLGSNWLWSSSQAYNDK